MRNIFSAFSSSWKRVKSPDRLIRMYSLGISAFLAYAGEDTEVVIPLIMPSSPGPHNLRCGSYTMYKRLTEQGVFSPHVPLARSGPGECIQTACTPNSGFSVILGTSTRAFDVLPHNVHSTFHFFVIRALDSHKTFFYKALLFPLPHCWYEVKVISCLSLLKSANLPSLGQVNRYDLYAQLGTPSGAVTDPSPPPLLLNSPPLHTTAGHFSCDRCLDARFLKTTLCALLCINLQVIVYTSFVTWSIIALKGELLNQIPLQYLLSSNTHWFFLPLIWAN